MIRHQIPLPEHPMEVRRSSCRSDRNNLAGNGWMDLEVVRISKERPFLMSYIDHIADCRFLSMLMLDESNPTGTVVVVDTILQL